MRSEEFYRAIVIGDVHMSNALPGAHVVHDGITDRLEDQRKLWKHVGETAEAHDVDDTFVVGDLFDKARVDPVTLTVTTECLVQLPNDKRLLPGNHDSMSINGGRFATEAFGAMDKPDFHFLRTGEPYCPREWLAFHPLAFMPVGESRLKLAAIRELLNPELFNVLLFHNSILGCSHLSWKCDDGLSAEEVCEGFDQVVAGHFHEHQTFGPDGRGFYVSAPMHHSYQDVGRTAGYWLLTYRRGKAPKLKYIDPGLPKFHVITVKDGKITKPTDVRRGDFLRWLVHATPAEWVALKPQVHELVERQKADGIRAEYKHKPIHVAEARLATSEEPGADASVASLDKQLSRFVKRTGTGDLDVRKVIAEGRSILSEARLEEK